MMKELHFEELKKVNGRVIFGWPNMTTYLEKISFMNEQKLNEVELEQVSGGMPHEKEIEKYDGQHGFITKDPFGNVTFTDKTGAIGKYSASDWTKLSANWAYTGNPEFYMSTINVDELNGILSGI